MLELNKIYNMDCLEGLKQLPDNSIDSIVTDPPYELGFMGKEWDKTGITYNIALWKECLRVLKPGGHLLAFGGSRTYHRMACAIEDVGFEIRDCVMWIYGQGFPKSYNISKGIESYIKQGSANWTDWKQLEGAEYKQKTGYVKLQAQQGYRNDYSIVQSKDIKITTTEAKQWEGWGTALKPAYEPIVVARKPLSEKNVALNVLKWGTGGINIDECRIPTNENLSRPHYHQDSFNCYGKYNDYISETHSKGRFPANVIFDEETAKMLDEQSGELKSPKTYIRNSDVVNSNINWNPKKAGTTQTGYGDKGGASRFFKRIDYDEKDHINFFYCAKASKKERGKFNNHPCVKPLKLIEYLITLVTPPNGICLDPFEGSGTHALACIKLGFNYIGFEINKEYCKIAEKRINESIKN